MLPVKAGRLDLIFPGSTLSSDIPPLLVPGSFCRLIIYLHVWIPQRDQHQRLGRCLAPTLLCATHCICDCLARGNHHPLLYRLWFPQRYRNTGARRPVHPHRMAVLQSSLRFLAFQLCQDGTEPVLVQDSSCRSYHRWLADAAVRRFRSIRLSLSKARLREERSSTIRVSISARDTSYCSEGYVSARYLGVFLE